MASQEQISAILSAITHNPRGQANAVLGMGIAGVVQQLTRAADRKRASGGVGRGGASPALRDLLKDTAPDQPAAPVGITPEQEKELAQLYETYGLSPQTAPPAIRDQLEKMVFGGPKPGEGVSSGAQSVVDSQLQNQPQPSRPQGSSRGGMMDKIQLALDGIGIIDPTPVTDGVNAAISLGRAAVDPSRRKEHMLNAGISGVSAAVPYFGDAAKLGKVPAIRRGLHTAGHVASGWMGGGSSGGGGGGEPPEETPRFGAPTPDPERSGSLRDERRDADGVAAVDKWTTKLKDSTLAIASFAGKAYLAVEGLQLLNRGVMALNRDLADKNGRMAGVYAKDRNDQFKRDQREASALAGPMENLQREQSELADTIQNFSIPVKWLGIQLLAGVTAVANGIIDMAKWIPGLTGIGEAMLEEMKAGNKQDAPGGVQFLRDLSDGKFDGFSVDSAGDRLDLLRGDRDAVFAANKKKKKA